MENSLYIQKVVAEIGKERPWRFPGRLKIQVTPYYANGRDYKFYWNDNLVYSVDDIKDAGRGDFRVFLYGYSTSVTTWNRIDISQEHFIERYSPHFKEQIYLLNGAEHF